MTAYESDAVKVLYIAGFGRSGSTLVGNVLGSVPGFCSVGELHMLATALGRRSGCGCGRQVEDCAVWSRVLQRMQRDGHWPNDPMEVRQWQMGEARVVHTPRLLRLRGKQLWKRPALDRYTATLGALYRTISEVTGARVIVDTSKTPADAVILDRIEGITARVIHLIRDPRAVAVSQRRRRPTLDPHRADEMHRRGVVASAIRWVLVNRLAEAVVGGANGDRTFRYEDFVRGPVAATRRMLELVGESTANLPFIDAHTANIVCSHTVWGNRSRFLTGPVELHEDTGWLRQRAISTLVTGITLPWLRRYGYPIRRPTPGRVA